MLLATTEKTLTLRLSEHYTSVQGEGPRTGILTQFVRFAGCNLRCPGWPCDTQHAIDPAIYRFQSTKPEPAELAEAIAEQAKETGARNICLTGGEPFLQDSQDLRAVIEPLAHPSRHYTFEVFTNGTFEFPEWTKDPMIDMQFTMDWKLGGSGERATSEAQWSIRMQNAVWLDANDALKFVVKDREDMVEAVGIADTLYANGATCQLWIGRVWDCYLTDEDIINFMQKMDLHDWHLNIQLHKLIWQADTRGV